VNVLKVPGEGGAEEWVKAQTSVRKAQESCQGIITQRVNTEKVWDRANGERKGVRGDSLP